METRIARRLSDGAHFIECPLSHWGLFLDAWKKDHSNPCPMPTGHIMFGDNGLYYRVYSAPFGPMVDAATEVIA